MGFENHMVSLWDNDTQRAPSFSISLNLLHTYPTSLSYQPDKKEKFPIPHQFVLFFFLLFDCLPGPRPSVYPTIRVYFYVLLTPNFCLVFFYIFLFTICFGTGLRYCYFERAHLFLSFDFFLDFSPLVLDFILFFLALYSA